MASIVERNGKFCVIYNYTTPDGKRKQKWETYKTEKEAKNRKIEIEYGRLKGRIITSECKTM